MEFPGFRTESFDFFRELAANNSHEWFLDNEDRYRDHVLDPYQALLAELGPFLVELDPRFQLRDDPEEHLSLLARGDRVPPGTPPYKTSFYAFFWDSSLNRLSDGSLYVGLSVEGVTIGFSIYDFGDPQSKMQKVFKPRLRHHIKQLDDYIKASYLRRGYDFHRYVRAPGRLGMREVEPFPALAPHWENTLGWVVKRSIHTESSRLTPGSFLAECKESFTRLYPLYVFTSDPRDDWQRVLRRATKSSGKG
jgi:uncharacterized protein (DUF2461 family)